MKPKKALTKQQALKKAQIYCAYQERCHEEVRDKLKKLGMKPGDADDIIVTLIAQGFLNEERYAKIFAGGKFRIKKWGRLKIAMALRRKDISDYCIRRGLEEIEEGDYLQTLRELITAKSASMEEPDKLKKRGAIAQYLIQKGYEPELVWQHLRQEKVC